jgi:hypothetical protein
MTDLIHPEGISYPQWLENLDISDLVSATPELAEYVPYIRSIFGAVKWVRNQRARHFLRSLKRVDESLPEDKRKRLHDRLKDPAAAEILADYADTVLRTASPTATAALALLYADADDEAFSPEFKQVAILALQGIRESQVDAFLDLAAVDQFITSKNQPELLYPVAIANDKLVSGLKKASTFLSPPEVRVAVIDDLIQRGLLLPDFASARLGDGGVGKTYGIGTITRQFLDLMTKAKALLPVVSEGSA